MRSDDFEAVIVMTVQWPKKPVTFLPQADGALASQDYSSMDRDEIDRPLSFSERPGALTSSWSPQGSLVYPIAASPTEAQTRVPTGWIRRNCDKTDPSFLLLNDSKIGSLLSDSWAQINRSILSSLHSSTISCIVMAIFP